VYATRSGFVRQWRGKKMASFVSKKKMSSSFFSV
jgi:hypothetical protein